ncbi:hypothetical protein Poli38472_011295 [Pythium oligandrum]|uniref:HRDC domain-containing protein n=1 Tax=Pythium oligandrum TaxID=41045 RepID=A0A8K1CQI2_PYTOL|nr:hypothetical protein Poli38472_011295 [Pythium oligandrum]|eukprot:TMW67675.1 hypothetical protein Poli38472_011295 [Pythium oligandrum]
MMGQPEPKSSAGTKATASTSEGSLHRTRPFPPRLERTRLNGQPPRVRKEPRARLDLCKQHVESSRATLACGLSWMRVKNLKNNRRSKTGEDDAGDGTEQSSTSPYKTPSPAASKGYLQANPALDIGADSPTDSSATLTVESVEVSELDLRHQATGHFDTHMGSMADATQQQTQVYASNGRADSWHDHVDRSVREAVHQRIVEYLKALKPNAPPKVLSKLPGLADRMEEALFKLASSEREYCDQTTLPQRLTLIQQANAKRLLQQQTPVLSPKEKDNGARVNGFPAPARKPLSEEQARVVFSCLQSWRQKLVNMYGAAPWEILPNQILAKVAVYIPATHQELVVCGVRDEQLQRFGNSLLQEIQKIVNALNTNVGASSQLQVNTALLPPRSGSPSTLKRSSPGSAKSSRKGDTTKRTPDNAANKKRKTTENSSPAVRVPVTSGGFLAQPPSFIVPAPVLIRPMDGTSTTPSASSLPALLPSGSLPPASSVSGKKSPFPSSGQQQAFFPRLPMPGAPSHEHDNRMHLLAQGAGQLSKQDFHQSPPHGTDQQLDAKTVELYEKELQTMRWLLQESQREKSQLENEVQCLRQQLQQQQ